MPDAASTLRLRAGLQSRRVEHDDLRAVEADDALVAQVRELTVHVLPRQPGVAAEIALRQLEVDQRPLGDRFAVQGYVAIAPSISINSGVVKRTAFAIVCLCRNSASCGGVCSGLALSCVTSTK